MPAPLIEFPADDPDRARRFWRGVLGVTLAPRPAAAGSGWQTETDGLRLGIHERGPGPGDTASLPYFTVADLATTLERVRAVVEAVAPEAEEGVSYGMPALRYRDSPLVSVVSAKGHIGLYPFSPAVVTAVSAELADYSWSKGTIRFTPEHPLPDSLVDRIILLRRDEIDAAKQR